MSPKNKRKKKNKDCKSSLLENTAFDLIDKYNFNKKDYICKQIFQKKWENVSGIELNKLIFFKYDSQQITSHYKINIHQFLDRLRRSDSFNK